MDAQGITEQLRFSVVMSVLVTVLTPARVEGWAGQV